MFQPSKTTRFFAVMLVAGGVLGIGIATARGLPLAWESLPRVVPMLGLIALFGWAVFAGCRLWQGAAYGDKWAPIIFASQIPILAVPGATYQWFTGAQLGLVMRLGDDSRQMAFSIDIGGSGRFFVGGSASGLAIGINLFAVVALMLLVRSNKLKLQSSVVAAAREQ